MLQFVPESMDRELEWDEDSERCFTIVEGLTPEQALGAMLPEAVTGIRSPREVELWADVSYWPGEQVEYRQAAFAGRHQSWTWVFEPNGFAGNHFEPRTTSPVPHRYVSVFWNVNAVMRFRYVLDGVDVREFDPLFRADHLAADDEQDNGDFEPDTGVGDLLTQEEGLNWMEPRRAAMTLLVRLSEVVWPSTQDLVRSAVVAAGYVL